MTSVPEYGRLHSTPRPVCSGKRLQDLFGEAVRERRQRLRRDEARDLPMADGRILAARKLLQSRKRGLRTVCLRQIVHAVQIAEAHGNEVRHGELRRLAARVQRIGSDVAELRRVGLIAHAAGVKNDQKYVSCFILSGNLEMAAFPVHFSSFTAVSSASFIMFVKPFCRSSAVQFLVSQQMVGHRADGKRTLACAGRVHIEGRSLHLDGHDAHLLPRLIADPAASHIAVVAVEAVGGQDVADVIGKRPAPWLSRRRFQAYDNPQWARTCRADGTGPPSSNPCRRPAR